MNSQLLGVVLTYVLTLALAIPLGKYMAKVFVGERTWTDAIFNPAERLFFRLSRIDPGRDMSWKPSLRAMLALNIIWYIWALSCLMNQGWLPLKPDGNPS